MHLYHCNQPMISVVITDKVDNVDKKEIDGLYYGATNMNKICVFM